MYKIHIMPNHYKQTNKKENYSTKEPNTQFCTWLQSPILTKHEGSGYYWHYVQTLLFLHSHYVQTAVEEFDLSFGLISVSFS